MYFYSERYRLLLPTTMLAKSEKLSHNSKFSFEMIYQQSQELKAFFDEHEVRINKSPDLENIIKSTKEIHELWKKNRCKGIKSNDMYWDALSVMYICNVVQPLRGHPKAKKYLQNLTVGPLHIFTRGKSVAKNTLWELDIWRKAKKGGLNVELDEPDVIWNENNFVTGVACKKIYSLKNSHKTIQNAVRQIEKTAKYGFIAFNLDELTPPSKYLTVKNIETAAAVIQKKNIEFLQLFEKTLLRYVSENRVTGVIASTSRVVLIEAEKKELLLLPQMYVWVYPHTTPDHKRRIEDFKAAMVRSMQD